MTTSAEIREFAARLAGLETQVRDRSSQLAFIEEYKHLRAHGPAQFGWKAQDLNPHGAVGNAAAATAEKGKAVLDFQAAAFVDLCRDVDDFETSRLWRP